jgi:hypothetical protein
VEDRATNYSEKAYQTLDAKVEAQGRPEYVQTDEHGTAIPGYESDSAEDSDKLFIRQPDGSFKYSGFKIPYARYREDVIKQKLTIPEVMGECSYEMVDYVAHRKGDVRKMLANTFTPNKEGVKPKWIVGEAVRPVFKIYVTPGETVVVDPRTKEGQWNLDDIANNLDLKVEKEKRLRAQRMFKAYNKAMKERSSLIQTQCVEGFYYFSLRVTLQGKVSTIFSPMLKDDLSDDVRKEIERKAAEKSAYWRKIKEEREAQRLLFKKVHDEKMDIG